MTFDFDYIFDREGTEEKSLSASGEEASAISSSDDFDFSDDLRDDSLYRNYAEYLTGFSIHVLRNVGRFIGVERPAAKKKEFLIDDIIRILQGEQQPVERSGRGAPVKENYFDPSVMEGLNRIRENYEKSKRNVYEISEENSLGVMSDGGADDTYSPVFAGTLVFSAIGSGYIKSDVGKISSCEDVFVSAQQISSNSLRDGDFITCYTELKKSGSRALKKVIGVCSLSAGKYKSRRHFDDFRPVYPDKRLSLSSGERALNLIDLACPQGRGQRTIVKIPKAVDRYAFIEKLLKTVYADNPEVKLYVVLLDGRGEDSCALSEKLRFAEVVCSDFDDTAERKIFLSEIFLKKAKRYAESGADTFLLVDSLSALARAYNGADDSSKRAVFDGFDYAALTNVKKYFGSAKKLAGGGSLTMLAFIDAESGRNSDQMLLSELGGFENSFLSLVGEREGFPSVSLEHSYTVKKESFLDEDELLLSGALSSWRLTDELNENADSPEKLRAYVLSKIRVSEK